MTTTLRENIAAVIARREQLRAEMIALQEEMDWLVYAAYGLIPVNHPACSPGAMSPGSQEKLWRTRLEAIRDNEHIRRIEAPVYKRRWDEQWKVGSRWQCGPIAYDAELVDAFDWWLSEKAEWWLEKKAAGGPVELEKWTVAMGADARVVGAWEVASDALGRLARRADFRRYFAALVKAQTVPDSIPWAVPWEKIEVPVPASARRIRGKLNVPRERFRSTPEGLFVWAGVRA